MYHAIIILLLVILLIFGILQYRLLREVRKQKQIAEDANKAKARFLASMSHEIRTPLNTILGMDELILRESTESAIKEYALDIQTAGQTLLVLLNDILDQRKLESGKLVIIPVEYDAPSMLYGLASVTKFRTLDRKLSFEMNVSPDMPQKLCGDVARIRQILMNLLENVVRNMQDGAVRFKVGVRLCKDGANKEGDFVLLHFDVKSTQDGIGLEEARGQFWEKLLVLMGSKLIVKNEVGRGSSFSFEIKQKIVDATPIGDFEKYVQTHILSQYKNDDVFQAENASVLVVDDNSINRKLLGLLLKPTRIRVVEADGGQEAIELAAKQHFDIIFMDHMMPGMDGIETMRRIKAIVDGPCANTPIIMLTANSIDGSEEKYKEEGFDGFLPKPVESEQLMKAIKEVLGFSGTENVTLSESDLEKDTNGEKNGILENDLNTEKSAKLENNNGRVKEFPVIFGIDWKVAMMRFQDRKTLESVLTDFEKSVDQQAEKLQEYKDGLPRKIEDYRILIHSMKSSSGSLGMIPLSGMAAVLEKAAAEGDLSVINKMHDVFLKEWKGCKEELRAYLYPEEQGKADKEEVNGEVLRVLLNMLATSMEEMDIDGADEAIEKLSMIRLPKQIADEFEDLKAAVTQLDQEKVSKILAGISIDN